MVVYSFIFRGEIYYAPKNEFTDDVMQRVEAKFGRLNDAKNTVDIFIPVVHRVRAWLRNHSSEVDRLKVGYYWAIMFVKKISSPSQFASSFDLMD